MNANSKAKVFVSYAHLDDKFRIELEIQLQILKQKGYLDWWTDQRMVPGDEFEKTILEELNKSHIILLLISSYFLASSFCWSMELAEAIKRHNEGSARVVPIFVRECISEETPIEKFHGIPPKSQPVSNWKNRHKAWTVVAKGIQNAVEEWRKN
jgi:hypothetical protein